MSKYKYRLIEDALLIQQLDILANEAQRLGESPFRNKWFEPFSVSPKLAVFVDLSNEFEHNILVEYISDESFFCEGEEYVRASVICSDTGNSSNDKKLIRHDWYLVDGVKDD